MRHKAKAVAEVSKIAKYRRLVAVNHGSQSESTDGPTSGWRLRNVVKVVVVLVVVVVVAVVLQSGCYCSCSCTCHRSSS